MRGAVGEVQEAVVVDVADVAERAPAVRVEGFRGLRGVVVVLEPRRALEPDPADLTRCDLGVVHVQLALAIGESAAIGPVDLRLLAGRGLEAHGGFGLRTLLGPKAGQIAAQHAQTAGVSHRADLLDQAHRREGTRLIALLQVRLVGIELRSTGRLGEGHRGRLLQQFVDRVAGVAGEAGNRAARVTLVEQLLDVHPFLHGEHASPSLAS